MKWKRFAVALLCAALLLTGCGQAQTPQPADPADWSDMVQGPDDKYRNWYEIFVYSFADSDGDGYGDLNGVTGKLDYIQELGCNGIWLMPIMPSDSYHKYDVKDYYSIDPLYGTMEDFRTLLEEAHSRGIRVIIDLVVNHTSSQHPWFQDALTGPESEHYSWYHFAEEGASGWNQAANGLYYESQFSADMPDLDLDNGAVRAEIEKIMAYWLEMGVDGFRLDACTSYYTGAPGTNVEFMTWLGDTARAIDPDVYIVGEVWTDMTTLVNYAQAGIDSMFLFPIAQHSGSIAKIMAQTAAEAGASYASLTANLEEQLPADTIPAPFLANHDTGRIASFIGSKDVQRQKMTAGLLTMMRGSIFMYYGDEIGMTGSGDDPNKRIGMLWTTEEETTTAPPGTTRVKYVQPGVETQRNDADSLLNYYHDALLVRNRHPEIARGATEILDCAEPTCALMARTYEGSTVYLAFNISAEAHTVTVPEGLTLADQLITDGTAVTLDGTSLALSPYSIAVLK